jgi:hypothetical protein
MPLVVPDRPLPRIAVGERIAVDRRAIPQPRQVAANLMGVGLAAAGRQRSALEPTQVAIEDRRPSRIEAALLVRGG